MGKYAKYYRKSPEKRKIHPIWRGIGLILIIIAPLMAFGMMVVFVPMIIASGKVPWQLLGYIQFPDWVFRVRIVSSFAFFIGRIQNLWLDIITFFVILLILTGVTSLLYAIIYTLVGPARYSPVDAPPPKHKGKFYKR